MDYVKIPGYPAILKRYSLETLEMGFFGVGVDISGGKVKNTEQKRYVLEELIESYFIIYESIFS